MLLNGMGQSDGGEVRDLGRNRYDVGRVSRAAVEYLADRGGDTDDVDPSFTQELREVA